jgi:hypothetical protein
MPVQPHFDPGKLGYYEKAGWEAYYNRNWLRVLRLMILLNHTMFGMGWPAAVVAAIDTVRASIAFAPVDNDLPATRRHLTAFYQKARRAIKTPTTADILADRELDYWVVHRRLAVQRAENSDNTDITPMVESLARLHAVIFDSTAEQMHRSAKLRAQAAAAVDEITGKRSQDIPGDWRRVEAYLQQAYLAVLEDV